MMPQANGGFCRSQSEKKCFQAGKVEKREFLSSWQIRYEMIQKIILTP